MAAVCVQVFQYITSEFGTAVAKINAARKPPKSPPAMIRYITITDIAQARKKRKLTAANHSGSRMPKHAGKAFSRTPSG
ncbi:MAG: hypothetical protein HQ583_02505 [Candidatus Abyssubacteria bacterium]|nr:hypothetical protein [Candidatus Abyssubacteria bacterium]